MKKYLGLCALIVLCLLLAGCHEDPTEPEPTPTPTATAVPSTPSPTLTPTPCPGSGVTIDGWGRLGDCNIRIHGRCWGIGCNNLKLGIFIAPTEPNVHQWFFQGYAVINEADGTWSAIGHLGPNATQCVREVYCLAAMPLAANCSFSDPGSEDLESNPCCQGAAVYWPDVRY